MAMIGRFGFPTVNFHITCAVLSDLALKRLEEASSLPTRQIDTTSLSPPEVARVILTELGAV